MIGHDGSITAGSRSFIAQVFQKFERSFDGVPLDTAPLERMKHLVVIMAGYRFRREAAAGLLEGPFEGRFKARFGKDGCNEKQRQCPGKTGPRGLRDLFEQVRRGGEKVALSKAVEVNDVRVPGELDFF